MALFGLFGGKKSEPKKGDFFLDFEEAQTLGDTDYMKQTKTIKRTFPKVKGSSQGKTIISQVSSDNMRSVDPNQVPSRATSSSTSFSSSFGGSSSFSSSFTSTPASTPTAQETTASEPVIEEKTITPPAPSAPKKVNTSMDMFRNMAKDIKR